MNRSIGLPTRSWLPCARPSDDGRRTTVNRRSLNAVRIPVRVKPGSRRERVGGSWGDDRVLVVSVTSPAIEGRANKAVVEALARALGVPRNAVSIVRGERGRNKLIEVDSPPPGLASIVERLREGS